MQVACSPGQSRCCAGRWAADWANHPCRPCQTPISGRSSLHGGHPPLGATLPIPYTHLCTESPCSTPAVEGLSRHTTQKAESSLLSVGLDAAAAAALASPGSEAGRLGATAGVPSHQPSSSRRGADMRRPDALSGTSVGRAAWPMGGADSAAAGGGCRPPTAARPPPRGMPGGGGYSTSSREGAEGRLKVSRSWGPLAAACMAAAMCGGALDVPYSGWDAACDRVWWQMGMRAAVMTAQETFMAMRAVTLLRAGVTACKQHRPAGRHNAAPAFSVEHLPTHRCRRRSAARLLVKVHWRVEAACQVVWAPSCRCRCCGC